MDEFNEYLKELALKAQKHPPKTAKRQVALGQLWNAIYYSNKLYFPPQTRIPASLNREEVYDEAVANLQLYICERIDNYNPTKATVIGWVNFLLKTRFVGDAIRGLIKDENGRIPIRPQSGDLDESHVWDELAKSQEQTPCLSEKVKQCLQEDPENLFKTTHIEGCPSANFQAIALRYMEQVSWQDMSREFGVKSPQTLSSFFQRCKQKFAPKIKQYIQE